MANGCEEEESVMPIDSPTFVPPNDQDLLLTDVTDAELFGWGAVRGAVFG